MGRTSLHLTKAYNSVHTECWLTLQNVALQCIALPTFYSPLTPCHSVQLNHCFDAEETLTQRAPSNTHIRCSEKVEPGSSFATTQCNIILENTAFKVTYYSSRLLWWNNKGWFYCWLCNYQDGGWNSWSLPGSSSTHWYLNQQCILCILLFAFVHHYTNLLHDVS